MAKQLLQCIEGTRDYLGDAGRRFEAVFAAAAAVFARYDYAKITTPVFEPTELFARGIGSTTDIVEKEMYTFAPGSDSLTLRPEGTAGVIRAYLQHSLHKQGGLQKLWYAGPMFRRERPQKGRQRQFHQVGCEAVGSPDPLLDAEVIALGLDFFRSVGIAGVRTRLNSIGCPACRPAYREALKQAVAPLLPQLCKSCQARYERNPLRIVDCKACAALTRELPAAYDYLCPECQAHFAAVKGALDSLGVAYDVDKTLVRGLDYYTKTVFEFTHSALGAQDAIGGGGRYDGLVRELGDVDMPAVGFAIGVERVMMACDALGVHNPERPLDVFGVALGAAAKNAMVGLLAQARAAGLSADMDFGDRSLKAQMRAANHKGATVALILGDSELSEGKVTVKDLREGGGQAPAPLGSFLDAVRPLLAGEPGK
ncbi:MAG: histidine--tRNA ligase [Planctomycetes bacterium]|nr:histidine--tRNA ligase [Planctomycetota bacterium]